MVAKKTGKRELKLNRELWIKNKHFWQQKKVLYPLGASRPEALATLAPRLSRHEREVCYNFVMAFIRKFETSSGATGVQVLYKEQGKVVKTIHVGSAKTEKGITKLLRKAQDIIDADKVPLFDLDKYNKN